MKLSVLLAGDGRWPLPLHIAGDGSDPEITGMTADSRAVQPGFLFAALPGANVDGARFIDDAIANGAVALLVSDIARVPEKLAGVTVIRSGNPRRDLARYAANFHALQPENVVAVTGTSGKTSVADFTRQLLIAAGLQAASVGTIGVVRADGSVYGGLTTPDPVTLHATLAELAREGVTHLAMEASSHGLDQHRLDGVRLKAAAFTNLGRDHLDYHPTLDHYLQAKLRLFTELLPEGCPVVVNADGAQSEAVAAAASRRGLPVLSVGRAGRDISIGEVVREGFAQKVAGTYAGQSFGVSLPLIGDYQIENAFVAAGLAIAAGAAPETVFGALETLRGVSGRLEIVGEVNGGLVVVDYAHKPEALAAALDGVRPFATGKLTCVFGCGGDRDQGKRPIMGAIAAEKADKVIVTDDNPRNEQPAVIRRAILEACPGGVEIGDRREAILAAIGEIGEGDVVLIAGKGHETGQIVGDKVLPFSDQEVASEAIAALAADWGALATPLVHSESPPQDEGGEAGFQPDPIELVGETVSESPAALNGAGVTQAVDFTGASSEPDAGAAGSDAPVIAEAPSIRPDAPVLWRWSDIVPASGGFAEGQPTSEIHGISIDSRSIAPGDLFVALADRRDGHDFVANAFAAGAAAALVRHDYARKPGDGPLIRVADTLAGLEAIGCAARNRLGGEARVIAVTGSVGKTTTKEMLRACLSRLGPTHAADKSFNNHLGVPLTLARMPSDSRFAVFEIGMNHAGEISPLTRMVRPHAAIITTVAGVHLENFASVDEIAAAKAEILEGLEPGGIAVLNRDNDYFGYLKDMAKEANAQICDFGASPFARVSLQDLSEVPGGSHVVARLAKSREDVAFDLAIAGRHNVTNALAVLGAMAALGIDYRSALPALSAMAAPKGRGERIALRLPDGGSALLIDESYNANPASMRAAIAVLASEPRDKHPRRIAIVGDMLELGSDAPRLHADLASVLSRAGVDRVYCAGGLSKALFDALEEPMRGGWAETPEELEAKIVSEIGPGDAITIKGSNGARTWKLAEALRRHFQA